MGRVVGEDPGLSGVVPFRFDCHRCGNCCTHGEGYIWLGEGEEQRLAMALELSIETFVSRYVVEVPDPRDGRLRRSLRTESGRCLLLEGANHCGAYDARPDHCRKFPYWSSVLEDEAGFERARQTCPGIEPELNPIALSEARAELASVIAGDRAGSGSDADDRHACPFEHRGANVWVTGLEAELLSDTEAREGLGDEGPIESGREGCPWNLDGSCLAPSARPHACRAALGDGDAERRLAEVRVIEARHGIPTRYTPIRTRRSDRVPRDESR